MPMISGAVPYLFEVLELGHLSTAIGPVAGVQPRVLQSREPLQRGSWDVPPGRRESHGGRCGSRPTPAVHIPWLWPGDNSLLGCSPMFTYPFLVGYEWLWLSDDRYLYPKWWADAHLRRYMRHWSGGVMRSQLNLYQICVPVYIICVCINVLITFHYLYTWLYIYIYRFIT